MYKNPHIKLSTILLALFSLAISINAQDASNSKERKQIFVHYMPWYASKPVSGSWGWHWTMNKFNPDESTVYSPQVASHFHPTIRLYDSGDPLLIEYHVQLMKLSGISGVIIDWYGVSDFRDYGMIHRNTQSLIKVIKQAGLKYAICYEDQTLKHRMAEKKISSDQVMEAATADFRWLKKSFSDAAYLKIDGRPVLLVFGPQHLQASQWSKITSKLNLTILGLPHLSKKNQFDGAFGWPPVHGGKTVTQTQWSKYLDNLDARADKEQIMSVAFPGFKDIYKEAGIGESYGYIDAQKGKTFERTLDRALKGPSQIIQIATWNDFGEGTNIEPTSEYGLDYLKIIQDRTKAFHPYKPDDLKFPRWIYQLRQNKDEDDYAMKVMNTHSKNLLEGQIEKVRNGTPFNQ